MKKNIIKIAGLALASAFAISAYAEVAIHQNVNLYGYAAGSVQYTKPNSQKSDTTMDLDAAKLGLAFNFAPVTAKVSIYTDAGADELYLLEANATYDIGNGFSLTGGRFQSWIGYEAFDIPNQNFISNGVVSYKGVSFMDIIPNFHEGLRFDYNLDKMNFGVAVVNSIYNGVDASGALNMYSGDGSLSDGYGIEAHFGYNDGAFSLGATLAYQDSRRQQLIRYYEDYYMADVWAQYVINQKTTIGAEVFYRFGKETGYDDRTDWYALVMVKHQFNEKFSLAGRFTYGDKKFEGDSSENFWKISAQPAYAVTQNLSLGLEVSYAKFNKAAETNWGKDAIFAGVQAVFKF